MDALKKNWKLIVLVLAVAAAGAGYFVYAKFFRTDPAFVAEQQRLQEQRDKANEALGVVPAEDDFEALKASDEPSAE
ncbi:MAG: hypothetical protein H6744_11510 [Deltaproteobacteria bacterium]|nr:hypothetical protein [Deltaproteobacteria bacterium]MCB9787303.1 hypothetical protein [Deltaproteobacteria bacterium]